MRQVIIFGLIVLLAGCAQLKTTDYSPPQWAQLSDEHLDAYIGQDIDRAQKVFGYQFSTKNLSGQQTVYTWELERQVGLAFSPFGFTRTVHCHWSFVTGPNGKILSHQRFGYCPSATLTYHGSLEEQP
ncbi:MAG: hypothetical protein OEZ51_02980 [Nitrospinota bacterium]|nr:hypothetical protein [Nitrospinota bacterium]